MTSTLKKSLGPLEVWGLAVGLVISGEYFGWSYGWSVAGPAGFLISTLWVAGMYVLLMLGLTELSTAIPDAGGPYAFVERALGPRWGKVAGIATLIEFLFAPPAIAFALGSYLHVVLPTISSGWAAFAVLACFGLLNLIESKQSARFELLVTLLAVGELLIFIVFVLPHFRWENFSHNLWSGGVSGVFASLPFAIWFFLGIEGVAMAAEEVRNPGRTLPRGILSGIATLVVLAFGVMFAAGGAGDWKSLSQMDYPIPEAVSMALGPDSPWVKRFAGIGLFGLVASLNGILFGAARQVYAVARGGLLPQVLTRVNKAGVPAPAVGLSMGIGILSVATGKTADLIVLSAFGALAMLGLSMVALLRLRVSEPELHRPFLTPGYPWVPGAALLLTGISFVTLTWNFPRTGAVFLGIVILTAWTARLHPKSTTRRSSA